MRHDDFVEWHMGAGVERSYTGVKDRWALQGRSYPQKKRCSI